jgi:hypothetical protein
MRSAFGVMVLVVGAAVGAEPDIRLPEPAPVPAPVPPAPGSVLRLSGEALYVVDADVDHAARAHPRGLVKVTKEVGPLRVRARFADGNGSVETRTYKGKFLSIVEATGTGRVELDVIPFGLTSEDQILSRTIDVDAGEGPRPPPTPVDPPDPPAPKDVPLSADPAGLRVLVVYDSLDPRMTPGQREVIFGADVRKWLADNCVKDGFRIYPEKSLADIAGEAKHWRDAVARERKSLPWCVVSNGRTFYEGPLPAGKDAFTEEAGKHK